LNKFKIQQPDGVPVQFVLPRPRTP